MITQDDMIYFIVTDRFFDGDPTNNEGHDPVHPKGYHGGDLAGILQKAPYLKHLGVTAVWITPVYVNTEGFSDHRPYHYYWAKDFEKMDARLYTAGTHPEGSMAYLADFVRAMHGQGLKVILDVVINHGGYGIEAGRSRFTREWFNDPNLPVRDDADDGSLDGLPDFDHDNVNVVDYFITNLLDWIEVSGIDGLRMDTAFHVENRFWYYYKSLVRGRFPDIFLVGEVLKFDISLLVDYQRDYDFHSVFDFPLREAILECFVRDEPLTRLARPRLHDDEPYGVLDLDSSTWEKRREGKGGYANANRLVTLLDNHDLDKRILSHAREKHPGEGGKALAFRVVELCYAFLLTVRGIPQLYYGSELGLEGWKHDEGGGDADLRRDFPWHKLEGDAVGEAFALEARLFTAVHSLLHLRKGHEALRYGVMVTLWVDPFVYAFLRYFRESVVLVVFNNGYEAMPSPLGIPLLRNTDKTRQTLPDRVLDLLAEGTMVNAVDNGDRVRMEDEHCAVQLQGKSYKVYHLLTER